MTLGGDRARHDLAAPGGVSLRRVTRSSRAAIDVRACAARRPPTGTSARAQPFAPGMAGLHGLPGDASARARARAERRHAGHLRRKASAPTRSAAPSGPVELAASTARSSSVPRRLADHRPAARLARRSAASTGARPTQRLRATRTVTRRGDRGERHASPPPASGEIGRRRHRGDRAPRHRRSPRGTAQDPTGEAGLIYENFVSRDARPRVPRRAARDLGRRADVPAGRRGHHVRARPWSTTRVAGVRQFDAVRFAGALGESFRLGGTLSSPQGAAQDAFGVRLRDDGRR